MSEMRETLAGRTVLAQRLGTSGLNVIEHRRYPDNRRATYFVIGDDQPRTDITISDEFLSDLPASAEYRAVVDSYARAVAGRLTCGSPEVFSSPSGIAVRVSIQWPIQSAVVDGVIATFILFTATNRLDEKVAKCSMRVAHRLGHTVFDTLVETVNSLRVAIDEGLVTFYDPSVRQEVFQKLQCRERFEVSTQAQIEQFLERKAYILGFLAVEQPTEIWAADPWDAQYLGVSTKELLLAMRVLRARGLVEAASSYEYVMPTDKLLAKQTAGENADDSFLAKRSVTLSNLPNKEELLEDLEKLFKHHSVSALLVIDLDNFKAVNDTNGHPAGDACLEQVVKTLASIVGRRGKLYRWGGDEFAVCLPNFSTDEAHATAERIRIGVEAAKTGGDIALAASIGVCATDRVESTSAKEILDLADKAMYHSKHSGKNRVTVWPVATTARSTTTVPKPSKQVVKTQLAQFLKEARQIQDGLNYSNFDSLRQKQEWEKRVEEYLEKESRWIIRGQVSKPRPPADILPGRDKRKNDSSLGRDWRKDGDARSFYRGASRITLPPRDDFVPKKATSFAQRRRASLRSPALCSRQTSRSTLSLQAFSSIPNSLSPIPYPAVSSSTPSASFPLPS